MRMDKAKAAPAKVKGGVPALLGRTWNSIPADSKSEYRIPENKKNTENKTQNRGCRNTLEFGLVVVGWNWSLGNQLLANNDWLAPTAIHCNAIKQDCAVLLLFRRWSMSSLWISVVTDSLLPSHKCHLATATNCQGNHPNQPTRKVQDKTRGTGRWHQPSLFYSHQPIFLLLLLPTSGVTGHYRVQLSHWVSVSLLTNDTRHSQLTSLMLLLRRSEKSVCVLNSFDNFFPPFGFSACNGKSKFAATVDRV